VRSQFNLFKTTGGKQHKFTFVFSFSTCHLLSLCNDAFRTAMTEESDLLLRRMLGQPVIIRDFRGRAIGVESAAPLQRMLGQAVIIRDFRRRAIGVDPCHRNQAATTTKTTPAPCTFLLETAPSRYQHDETYNNNGEVGCFVTFRLINNSEDQSNVGNNTVHSNNISGQEAPLYLTINMYGDEAQRAITEAVANSTPLLPVHVPLIVDFLVDRPTGPGDFEGPGFNYSPMTLSPAPKIGDPSFLQVFQLLRLNDYYGLEFYSIKTLFGTYWRSEHWNNTISQSPHVLRDERWRLKIYTPSPVPVKNQGGQKSA
jgi:hypothetical protein